MFRDLPSGIKRLPRGITNILVQGTEFILPFSSTSTANRTQQQQQTTKTPSKRSSSKLAVQVGIASCTGFRNHYVGEAWAVGENFTSSKKNYYSEEKETTNTNKRKIVSCSSSTIQIGVMDSRDNRAFEFLNSNNNNNNNNNNNIKQQQQTGGQKRDWSKLVLSKFDKKNKFLFSSYVQGRGSYFAVTPSTIVASSLAEQALIAGKKQHAANVKSLLFSNDDGGNNNNDNSNSSSEAPSLSSLSSHLFSSATAAAAATKTNSSNNNSNLRGSSEDVILQCENSTGLSAFSADFKLREQLLEGGKQFHSNKNKQQQKEQQSESESCGTSSSNLNTDPFTSGCRGIWATLSYHNNNNNINENNCENKNENNNNSRKIIEEEELFVDVHSVGDCRGVIISGKFSVDRPQNVKSGKLSRLQNLAKELPGAFDDDVVNDTNKNDNLLQRQQEENNVGDATTFSTATSSAADSSSNDSVNAMNLRLQDRRSRIGPLTVDHRPLRPEEARRIGRAASVIFPSKSSSSSSSVKDNNQTTTKKKEDNNNNNNNSKIHKDIIDENEFLCGDAAVNVSRAFGHFHLKNSTKLSPDEQLLTCRPDSVTSRPLRVGDVLVLGNKALFYNFDSESSSSSSSSAFVGGFSVTFDSIAAQILESFEGQQQNNNKTGTETEMKTVASTARDLVNLALLGGAEHNVSCVVLRVVAKEEQQEEEEEQMEDDETSSSSSTTYHEEYCVPGQIHPFLFHHNNNSRREVYANALRRDAWRCGYSSIKDFATARRKFLLENNFGQVYETITKNSGSTCKPSLDGPREIWKQMSSPIFCGGGRKNGNRKNDEVTMMKTHPLIVNNLIREFEVEYDWCVRESEK